MYHICPIVSYSKFQTIDHNIIKNINIDDTYALTIVSGNHVFFISIDINIFFITDHNQ